MRLESLELENYRGTSQRLVTFGAGVTIVEGPNEAGKSSLLEAMRLLREYKAGSKSRQVKAAQPTGKDVGPKVVLRARSGPYYFEYAKRWLKTPETVLTIFEPKNASFTGDEAHDKFQAILEQTLDADLLSALEVVQGESLEQAKLMSIAPLRTALDESGTDNADADTLVEAAEKEYSTYYTKTGLPTGRHKAAPAELSTACAELEVLDAEAARIDNLTAELEGLSSDRQNLRGLVAAARERRGQQDQVVLDLRQKVQAIKEARAEDAAKQAKFELAAGAAAERLRRVEEVAGLSRAAEQLRGPEREAAQALEDAGQKLTAAKEVEGEAARALAEAEESARGAAQMRESLRNSQDLLRLRSRRDKIRELTTEVAAAEEALSAVRVDQGSLDRLALLAQRVDRAEHALAASAATVQIENLGAAEMYLDGEEITGAQSFEVASSARVLEIPGQVRVRVAPAQSSGELDEEAKTARRDLADALAEAGVEDLAEARQEAEKQSGLSAAKKAAQTLLGQLEGEAGPGDLGEEIERLEKRLQEGQIQPDTYAAVSLEELDERARVADIAERDARASFEEASLARETAHSAFRSAESGLDLIRQEIASLQTRFTAADDELSSAREKTSDELLEETRRAAAAEAADSERARNAAEGALEGLDPEEAELRLSELSEREAQLNGELEKADEEWARVSAQLEAASGHGVYDRHLEKAAQVDQLEAEAEDLGARAAAAKLLRDTLVKHQKDAQAHYVGPLRAELERLARQVFGRGVEVDIDNELEIQSRTLAGVTVPFASLSAGAREQLGLLGRLATAALVDAKEGAPVIMDDTLGFADSDRLDSLGRLLSEVGNETQVVILTCQPDRYRTVTEAHVVRL